MQFNNSPKVFKKMLAANTTSANFTAPATVAAQPVLTTSVGVLDGISGDTLEIVPFGAGSNNNTMNVRVIGWSYITDVWVPKVLATLACTLSQSVGVSGKAVTNTDRFADAITVTDGLAVVNTVPADTAISAIIDISGYQMVTVNWDMNSSATSGNALYRTYGAVL